MIADRASSAPAGSGGGCLIEANIPGRGLARIAIDGPFIGSVSVDGPPDPAAPYCAPGFVDIQINGFAGLDFSSPELEPEQLLSLMPSLWATGVTSICPTLITNSRERLLRNFRVFEAARRMDSRFARMTPCYHLEGPYLAHGPRGAHNAGHLRAPDWDEFSALQEAAGGNIGILTLAPELPGALDMIRRAARAGVVVAIGHTEATPGEIHAAAAAGAALNTHLGNGCPQMLDRHRAPFWAQLADDRLGASLICDGFHLTPEMVTIIVRLKGIERLILITDAMHVAGLAPGRYSTVGTEIELLPTGQVVTADRRSMAGSALSLARAIRVFMRSAGVPLEDAIRAAAANPAALLGRPQICAAIDAGAPANLVCFRLEPHELRIERVWLGGQPVPA